MTHLRPAIAFAGGSGLTPDKLPDLHIYRALVLSRRGDTARACDDFITAATKALQSFGIGQK